MNDQSISLESAQQKSISTEANAIVGMLRQASGLAPDSLERVNFSAQQLRELGQVRKALSFSMEPQTPIFGDEGSAAAAYTFTRLRLAVGERPKDTKFLSRLSEEDKRRVDIELKELLSQRNLPDIDLVVGANLATGEQNLGLLGKGLRALGFRRNLIPQSSGE
jgi:hypothetical protein